MKRFWEYLQNADEPTKRRWMVAGTVVIMALVIYIWLAYFNNLIVGFGTSDTASMRHGSGVSFSEKFVRGTAALYENLWNGLSEFGRILQTPREYIIKPN